MPLGMAAVIATILSSRRASAIKASAKTRGVERRIRLGLHLFAGDDVEHVDAMIFVA